MDLKPEDAEDEMSLQTEQEAVVSPGVKHVNNSHWSVSGPVWEVVGLEHSV